MDEHLIWGTAVTKPHRSRAKRSRAMSWVRWGTEECSCVKQKAYVPIKCEPISVFKTWHCEYIGTQHLLYTVVNYTTPSTFPLYKSFSIAHFYLHKLYSVYESNVLHKTFHLHPEFVHQEDDPAHPGEKKEVTILCPMCASWVTQKKKKKTNSDAQCP